LPEPTATGGFSERRPMLADEDDLKRIYALLAKGKIDEG